MVNRNFDSRIQKFDKNNSKVKKIPKPIIQNFQNLGRILVIANVATYGADGMKIYLYLNKMSKFSWVDIQLYNSSKMLSDKIMAYYNLGGRCFLSPTIGEINMLNVIMPFFKSHSDAIYFDTYSTFNFDKSLFSDNMIFLAMNDQSTCEYIMDKIIYEYDALTNLDAASGLYDPISGDRSYNSNNVLLPIFENVVYIYSEKYLYDLVENLSTDDMYAYGYGDELYKASLKHTPDITFTRIMIKDDNFVLPDNVKNMLSENPVSGTYFKSRKKTIFIVNSSDPEKMLSLFDEEYMYDNYFILGDTFIQNHVETKFQFNYAIAPVGAFSYEGFKISKYISMTDGEYFSPFLYSLFDIVIKFQDFWKKYIFNKFNMNDIISDLKKNEYLIYNNFWHERKIFTYQIKYKDESNNEIYAKHIFFDYKFNPLTSGTFVGLSDIDLMINDDTAHENSISLIDFGWNSRNSIIQDLLEDKPFILEFFDETMINNWKSTLETSVGGDRNNSVVKGYKNHTPLFFELWRSHDKHFDVMNVNIEFNPIMDYFTPQVYNINQKITITRNCYKDAGINNDTPVDNFLYTETDEINLDFETNEISGKDYSNYSLLVYFKGNRYQKSFNGLTRDYFAPLLINIVINPTITYKKYNIDDFIICSKNDIFGKVLHVSDDYQEITIQPYITITEDINSYHCVIKNFDAAPVLSDQINTEKYPIVRIIDYTNWSVFRKNLFIRSIFMDSIINNDSQNANSMSNNIFEANFYSNINKPIKESVSLTFSTYNNWLLWQNKMNEAKNNNNFQSILFWEMCRSNSLEIVERTIELNIVMNNNKSKIYDINALVDIERKNYYDLNNYNGTETVFLPIVFKTSDIIPGDIINKPIIYLEYFAGNEYKNIFDGMTESYFSPVLININIVPIIIYNEYKINDYVILKDSDGNISSQIGRVLSVSDDNTIINVDCFITILDEINIIYVKSLQEIKNVSQNDIILYNDTKTIINLNNIGKIQSGNNIESTQISSINIEDSLINPYRVDFSFFNSYYNNNVFEDITNQFFLTFSNINSFNDFKSNINNEIVKLSNHTPIFFELWRSHSDSLKPINVNIDYELIMNDLTPNVYNINKSLDLFREIINENNETISSENFSINLDFNTQQILPSDILNNPIVYVSYFNGNKYLKFNEITNYYSPIVVTINIIPISISDIFKINDFVICEEKICKIISIINNFKNIELQYYSVVNIDENNNKIYIIKTSVNKIVNSNIILPYNKYYEMDIIDKTEWGPFDNSNFIINDSITSDIILQDSSSVGNSSLQDFNSNKIIFDGIKDNFNITMLNESIFTNFKKLINSSITFDKLNHTPLFFEIWRSHSNLIIPLVLEINYNLKMLTAPTNYRIIKNVSFIRNVYDNISISEEIPISKENVNIIIDITTPLITTNDISNNPIFFVNYFKGHKYINNFTNINEYYYGPIIVKINIIPYLNTKVNLMPLYG